VLVGAEILAAAEQQLRWTPLVGQNFAVS